MTMNRHYMEGFCKTAEAYGVDPNVLYKQALSHSYKLPIALGAMGALDGTVAGGLAKLLGHGDNSDTVGAVTGSTLSPLALMAMPVMAPGSKDIITHRSLYDAMSETLKSRKGMGKKLKLLAPALAALAGTSVIGGLGGHLGGKMFKKDKNDKKSKSSKK